MFEWYHLLIAGIAGAAFNDVLRWLKDRIERPYRYTCPEKDCNYKITGNDKAFIDELRTDHRRDHLREKEGR